MLNGKLCPSCGAPRRMVRELRWLSNGTIVQRKNPYHRMVFIECDNINATYHTIEEIIGAPVAHLLIEAKRKATFDFIDHMLLTGVKNLVKLAGTRLIARNITVLASMFGYGKIKLVDIRRIHGRDDYATFRITEPYSLPLFCGDMAGTLNAVDRREVGVTHEQVTAGVYEVTGSVSEHPLELKGRLEPRKYHYKPGDIEMERCPACGGPELLSQYRWDLERGVIQSDVTGHRKAMIGPAALESVVDELEREHGEMIPRAVIEAQKRFVKTGYYSLEEASSEEGLRMHLAKRGLGNLREMEWNGDRLFLRLENACLHLFLVGLAQGLFELATGADTEVAWGPTVDDEFTIEVKVKN